MADDLKPLSEPKFAETVTQLEGLLSQNRRAFLLGAGCSCCAGLPLMNTLTTDVLASLKDGSDAKRTLDAVIQAFSGSKTANIEDHMSELVDLLSVAERRALRGAKDAKVQLAGVGYEASTIREALDQVKQAVAGCIANRKGVIISFHRRFVRAVHGTLQAGKAPGGRTVDYFVLNYDTLLEDALGLERLSVADGFCGGATGWWDECHFRQRDVAARVFKVHGSIDWCLLENDVLPCRVRPGVAPADPKERVLIWPAATKYREAQRDSYAKIIGFMRESLRPATGAEVVLTVCGYSFGDAHINLELDRALRESERRLTIIVFSSEDHPTGQPRQWLDDPTVREQVRVHANRGFFHGADMRESTVDLPWWKFENVTRLLGGER